MSIPTHAELDGLYRQLAQKKAESDDLQARLARARREAGSGAQWRGALEKWRSARSSLASQVSRLSHAASQHDARNGPQLDEVDKLVSSLSAALAAFELPRAEQVHGLWVKLPGLLAPLEGPAAQELRRGAEALKREVDAASSLLRFAAAHDGRDEDAHRDFTRLQADAERARDRHHKHEAHYQRRLVEYRSHAEGRHIAATQAAAEAGRSHAATAHALPPLTVTLLSSAPARGWGSIDPADGVGVGSDDSSLEFSLIGDPGEVRTSASVSVQLGSALSVEVQSVLAPAPRATRQATRHRLQLKVSVAKPGKLTPEQVVAARRLSPAQARVAASALAASLRALAPVLRGAVEALIGRALEALLARGKDRAPKATSAAAGSSKKDAKQQQAGAQARAQAGKPAPQRAAPQKAAPQKPQPQEAHGKDEQRGHAQQQQHDAAGKPREAHGKKPAPKKPPPQPPPLHKELSVALRGAQVFAASTRRHQDFASLVVREKVREKSMARLERTASSFAVVAQRGMGSAHSAQMRSELAKMDIALARMKGVKGPDLLRGASEVSGLLGSISTLARKAGNSAQVAAFKKLVDERRAEAARLVGARPSGNFAEVVKDSKHALQLSAEHLGEQALERIKTQLPGLEKVLSGSARAQLFKDLAHTGPEALQRLGSSALGKLTQATAAKARFALGSSSLAGGFAALGGGRLGGLGGGGLGQAMSSAGGDLHRAQLLASQLSKARPDHKALQNVLGRLAAAPGGSPLRQAFQLTEEKQRKLNQRLHTAAARPLASQITGDVLREALISRGKTGLARELASGGALHALVAAGQRTLRGPLDQAASHYLSQRGHSRLYNSVSTFQGLLKDGWKPRFSLWGKFKGAVSHAASSVTHAVSRATQAVAAPVQHIAQAVGNTVRAGVSTVSRVATSAAQGVGRVVQRGVGAARKAVSAVGRAASHAVHAVSHGISNAAHRIGHAVGNVAQRVGSAASNVAHRALSAASNVAHRVGSAVSNAAHRIGSGASQAAHWAADKTGQLASAAWNTARRGAGRLGELGHSLVDAAGNRLHQAVGAVRATVGKGLDWARKTGVVGAVGGVIRKGISMAGTIAKYTPLGMAVRAGMAAGKWVAGGGLKRAWASTKDVAGKAWGGIKNAGKAVGGFLQSPAGQLLVTGLSVAATFIPGGLVVKTLIGAGIGAITAISEGKDWKGVLLSAGSGALSAAVPFLKIGPLAKLGVGALQGAASAVMQGGNWKDALKGAAGGAMDNFSPGAFKALGKMKSISTAGKLLSGGKLSKLEQAAMHSGGASGKALGMLERTMMKPGVQKTMAKLQQFGNKALKTGKVLSGKAAKAQDMLDKAISVGGKVQGALEQVHQYAPQLADMMGDNAVSRAVRKAGDYAGAGSDGLGKALEYGQKGSDYLSTGREYLDKGLKFAGGGKKGRGGKGSGRSSGGGDHATAPGSRGAAPGRSRTPAGNTPHHGLADAHAQQTGAGSRARGRTQNVPRTAQAGHPAGHHDAPAGRTRGGRQPRAPHADTGHHEGQARQPAAEAHAGRSGGRGAGHPADGESHRTRARGGDQHAHDGAQRGGRGRGSAQQPHAPHASPPRSGRQHDGAHHDAPAQARGAGQRGHGSLADVARGPHKKASALERAVARGRQLQQKALKAGDKLKKLGGRVSKLGDRASALGDKLSGRIGQISDVVQKGMDGAQKIQGGLEKASELARQGAAIFGEDSELGQFLGHAAERADQIHGYVDQGLSTAESVQGYLHQGQDLIGQGQDAIHQGQDAIHQGQRMIGQGQHALRELPLGGVHQHSPLDRAHHLNTAPAGRRPRPDARAPQQPHRDHPAASPHHDETAPAAGRRGGRRGHAEAPQHADHHGAEHPGAPAHDQRERPHGHERPGASHRGEAQGNVLQRGLQGVEKLRRAAGKAGGKAEHHINTLQHVLNRGIRLGKKVDGGLQHAASLAHHVGDMFGDDSALGHLANQLASGADHAHDQVGSALELAGKGKKGLKQGRDLLHNVLEHGQAHHHAKAEADAKSGKAPRHHRESVAHEHGQREVHHEDRRQGQRGHPDAAEHAQPRGRHAHPAEPHGQRRGHPGAHHGSEERAPRHHADQAPRRGHPTPQRARDRRSAHGGQAPRAGRPARQQRARPQSQAGGHARPSRRPARTPHGHAPAHHGRPARPGRHAKAPHAGGKHGKAPKHHAKAAKAPRTRGGRGRGVSALLRKKGGGLLRHLGNAALDAAHDFAEEELDELLHGGADGAEDEQADAEQAADAAGDADASDDADASEDAGDEQGDDADQGGDQGGEEQPGGDDHAQGHAAAGGAAGMVSDFVHHAVRSMPRIQKLMELGQTQEAHELMSALSNRSESARGMLGAAAGFAGKLPGLGGAIGRMRQQYLDVRGHLFKFVGTLHGIAGQVDEQASEGGPPDVAALAAEIDAFAVQIAGLGDVARPDGHAAGAAGKLFSQGGALRARAMALLAKHKLNPSAAGLVGPLLGKLGGLLHRAGAAHGHHEAKKKSDQALGEHARAHEQHEKKQHEHHERKKRRKRRPARHGRRSRARGGRRHGRRGHPSHGGRPGQAGHPGAGGRDGAFSPGAQVFVNPKSAARGEHNDPDQDLDPSAEDSWLGSGESTKFFADVFGKWLPQSASGEQGAASDGGTTGASGDPAGGEPGAGSDAAQGDQGDQGDAAEAGAAGDQGEEAGAGTLGDGAPEGELVTHDGGEGQQGDEQGSGASGDQGGSSAQDDGQQGGAGDQGQEGQQDDQGAQGDGDQGQDQEGQQDDQAGQGEGGMFGGMLGTIGQFASGITQRIGRFVGGLFGKKGKGGLGGKLAGFAKGIAGKFGGKGGLLGGLGRFAKGMRGRFGKFGKGGLFGKFGKFGKKLGGLFGGKRGKGGLFGKIGGFAKSIAGKFTKKGGLLSGLFGKLHGFADKLGGFLKKGNGLLGKAMGFAEKGMGFVDKIGGAADKVSALAGKAEGFLNKFHLGGLANLAHGVGGLADKVHGGADAVHGGLDKASSAMGSARSFLKQASAVTKKASGAFGGAEKGHFGRLANLFRAGKTEGIENRMMPERVRMGSAFDEPQRLDLMTMHRMERFLGATFHHVRVHTGPGAAEITRRYDAEAVTVRDHIFFAPGRFDPSSIEGQRLIAHELTHVTQKGRPNLDVRTAESEALRAEHTYGAPRMETLNLGQPRPDFMLADGAGQGMSSGLHTAKRTRSKKEDGAPLDEMPDGEEMLDKISERVYELMMEELESSLSER